MKNECAKCGHTVLPNTGYKMVLELSQRLIYDPNGTSFKASRKDYFFCDDCGKKEFKAAGVEGESRSRGDLS